MDRIGTCPLTGRECVGEENCAPAKFTAYQDEEGKQHYKCPISTITDSLQALAFSMEPFVRGLIGVPHEPAPTVESLGREKFIEEIVKPEGRS